MQSIVLDTCLGLCMEFMFGTLIFVSMEPICMKISHLKYGFVGEKTLIPLSLPMFGLEEPYLCIKVIFVGFSSVVWLVLVQFCCWF